MRSPTELLDVLVARGHFPRKGKKSRADDIKTALRKLADAYGTTLDRLDLTAIESTYLDRLRTYFAECSPVPSVHVQRNTVQNAKQFFRLLHEEGFLKAPTHGTQKRTNHREVMAEGGRTSPYRSRTSAYLLPYYVTYEQWPAAIRDAWEGYCAQRSFDLRATTIDLYTRQLRPYISYTVNVEPPPISTWDEVFNAVRVAKFITWHAKRVGAGRVSSTGFQLARLLAEVARIEQHPEADSLKALLKKLPAVRPWHNKQAPYHTISAGELEGVGLKLLAQAKEPMHPRFMEGHKHPGLMRACYHRTSLLIRFMWRLPLRSRSIREMELGKNLFQDDEGRWQVRYVGDELKVSERNGRINTFQVPWPAELTEQLEEYLREYRPRFPFAETLPNVFLTYRHGAFTSGSLYQCISKAIYLHLRKRLFPHLLRTLWVDQYLLASNGDVSTAAYILNDSVTTMLKRYHELRGSDHIQKAYQFNQAILASMARQASTDADTHRN